MEVAREVGTGEITRMKGCMRASGRTYQRRDSLPQSPAIELAIVQLTFRIPCVCPEW